MNIDISDLDQNQEPYLESNEEIYENNEQEDESEQDSDLDHEILNYNILSSYRSSSLLSDNSNNYLNFNSSNTFSSTNTINRILRSSFYDKYKYKNVLSEQGNDNLERIIYTNSNNLEINTTCPIYQVNFNDGMELIKLPCKHCFIPEAIEKWLKEENAICPVCRYKLDSMEVEDTNNNSTNTDIINPYTNTTNYDDLFSSLRRSYNLPLTNPLWQSNTIINNNLITIPEPTQEEQEEQEEPPANPRISRNFIEEIMDRFTEYEDEDNLQRAILDSYNVGVTPEGDTP